MSTKTQKKTVPTPSTKEPQSEKSTKGSEGTKDDSSRKEKPTKKQLVPPQEGEQKPKKKVIKSTAQSHEENPQRDSVPPNERETADSRSKKIPTSNLNRKQAGAFIGEDKPKTGTKKGLEIPEDRKDLTDSQDLSDDLEREKPSTLEENGSPQSEKTEPAKQSANQTQQALEETKSNPSKKNLTIPTNKSSQKEPETLKSPTGTQQPTPVEGRASKLPQPKDQPIEPKPLSPTMAQASSPDSRASKFFGQTQPVISEVIPNNPLSESPEPEKSLALDLNSSPRMELPGILPSETNTNPISFIARMKGRLSPKYAHNLTHGKSMMKVDKVVTEGDNKTQDYISDKHFYYDVLKELEKIPLHLENDDQVEKVLAHADKEDQVAFQIVEKRFEKKYAQALYHIFFKYGTDNDNVRVKLTLGKLYYFMKDFDLYNENITKERASLLFSKRIPNKLADFAGFVDILYKFSKYDTTVNPEPEPDHNKRFQKYLDAKIISKHSQMIESAVARHPRVAVFGDEYNLENEPLRIFEGHDDFLKHLFTLYESFDIHYSNHSIIHLKDFKKFLFDYCIIPVLVSVHEAVELFRRFQLENKPVADFRGFIMIMGFIANIGLDKGNLKGKYDSYSKKLLKFFDMLLEINQRISDELVLKHMIKCKE